VASSKGLLDTVCVGRKRTVPNTSKPRRTIPFTASSLRGNEQTFSDILRARTEEERGLFGFALRSKHPRELLETV
jgi:hypothetical protein